MVSCKQVSCADDAVHVRRRTHARRCYGPESDAEFLRSIADKTPGRDDDAQRRRQVYLTSYYIFASNSKATCSRRAKAGKLLSHLLTRLLSCACNPAAAA